MTGKTALLSLAAALAATTAHAADAPSDIEIIRSYAEDYEQDATFKKAVTFGVDVGGDFYTVTGTPAADGAKANVTVTEGAPETPTFYFTVKDSDYLNKLANGDYNVLTLMAKAFSTDVTPMDIETQVGFQPDENFGADILPLTFHFWTKGKPELIPFGPEMTQKTHGSNAGIFYYQTGFRSGWFNIEPGDHVNEDERSRDNPFPSLLIMISGEVKAIIGGEEMTFNEGNAMLVPAGVTHEFINNGDEPAFGFLFMFGDGA